MARRYTLKRRAEQQAETRQRIVDAAIDLHGTIGPARTTMSMVAERAGVQRRTLYAHFPDEWSLSLACSGTSLERDPLPEATSWREIDDDARRLRTGLSHVYGWFSRNAGLAGCVLRDAEAHEPTARIIEHRMGSPMRAWRAALCEGRPEAQSAMVLVALDFATWRTLTRDGGLSHVAAVEAMACAVEAV